MIQDDVGRVANRADTLRLTAAIVGAFAAHNPMSPDQLQDIIRTVYKTIDELARGAPHPDARKQKPAVPVSKSVNGDYIVCLNDGRKFKMLKRYLRQQYDMSPEDYRKLWGLPADYPMVAPNYAARRSEFAKKIGLGKGVRRKD